jgi:hypothetical protein
VKVLTNEYGGCALAMMTTMTKVVFHKRSVETTGGSEDDDSSDDDVKERCQRYISRSNLTHGGTVINDPSGRTGTRDGRKAGRRTSK